MRDKDDLIREALGVLGVEQNGQDIAEEDGKIVRDAIPGLLARLSRLRVVFIDDVEQIDDAYFEPLGLLLANTVASKFGGQWNGQTDATQTAILRAMQREPGVSETVYATYF